MIGLLESFHRLFCHGEEIAGRFGDFEVFEIDENLLDSIDGGSFGTERWPSLGGEDFIHGGDGRFDLGGSEEGRGGRG